MKNEQSTAVGKFDARPKRKAPLIKKRFENAWQGSDASWGHHKLPPATNYYPPGWNTLKWLFRKCLKESGLIFNYRGAPCWLSQIHLIKNRVLRDSLDAPCIIWFSSYFQRKRNYFPDEVLEIQMCSSPSRVLMSVKLSNCASKFMNNHQQTHGKKSTKVQWGRLVNISLVRFLSRRMEFLLSRWNSGNNFHNKSLFRTTAFPLVS